MANVKISDLTAAASALGAQEFEVNEGGVSKKVTGAQIATYVEGEVSSSPTFTGVVSIDDGSASAPALTNTGDTNTGVYFPAADEVAIATGGTERLKVDSNGITNVNDLKVAGNSIATAGSLSNRNKIINGNFDIWQRGTSGASGYVADRWYNISAGSTAAISRQAFTLGQTDVPNEPTYFHRAVVTSVSGSGNLAVLQHRIEGVRTFAGQTVTLSFWAKADASKNIAIDLEQNFAIGGSATVAGIGVTTCALTTSWQKFTITATVPSISGKTIGTNGNDFFDVTFWFDAGSGFNSRTNSLGQQSGTFDIAQVQLEAGDVATPFEVRSIGQELALCQRYYQKSYKISDFAGSAATDGAIVAVSPVTNCRIPVFLQVSMRTLPTVTFFSTVTGSSGVVRDNTGGVDVSITGAGFVSEKSFVTSGLSLAAADREVRFQYTTDAEL